MGSRLPSGPNLVGRTQEINQLMKHFDSALNGKGATIFISGEAGVGKTRLVDEFLKLAKTRARILSGWCLSEAAIPYFPFTEAFTTYIATTSDEKARSTMKKQLGITGWLKGPELATEPRAHELISNPEIERDRTFETVARVLLQLSVQEPLILFLDDLQWADQLSLALIHYLSRKCRNSRLLIIGTYRPEELIRTKEEKLHPLEQTMFSMSREDLLVKTELDRLKRDDFPEFLRSILHSSTSEEFVEKLYKETEGNPFFALETLNLLVEEDFISERKGSWTLSTPLEKLGIPSKVHEVITQRIAKLERGERKLLDLAAICGYSFSPDILSKALTSDIADVLQTLAEIEQRHRLIRSEDSTFEFTHHKIREVICENLPSELRRVYHLKTASCLEQVLAQKTSDGYLAEIALHYVEGGAPEKAFGYLVNLGEKAVDIYANLQAKEYLNKALEATQKNASLATAENLFEIYKLRGRALWNTEGAARAIDDFELVLQNATKTSNESMIAEAHYWLGSAYSSTEEFSPFFSLPGFRARVMPHLTTALELARKVGNKPLEGRIQARIGGAFIATVDTMDEGFTRLEEAYKACKETGDTITEANLLSNLALYYNWKGEFSLADENMKKALALEEEIGVPQRTTDELWMLSIIQAGRGEYNDAISSGQRCLQLAREYDNAIVASWMLNTFGWIYHDLSSIELASKYNNESIELARAGEKGLAFGGVPHALANLGNDCLCKNDYGNAEKYFKEASGLMHLHPTGWWRMEIRVLLGRGEIAVAKGDYSQALKFAEDSLEISEKAGAKKFIAKGFKLKAEVLAEMDRTEEAVDLMEKALKLAQELGNPPLLWQTHYSMGLLLEKHGNLQKANQHFTEAAVLIEETASKLRDASLRATLLAARQTKAIHDAYARTKPASKGTN